MQTSDYIGIGILGAVAYALYALDKNTDLTSGIDNMQLISDPRKIPMSVDIGNDRVVTDTNIPEKDISNLDGRLILRVGNKDGGMTSYKVDPNKLTSSEKRAISSNNFIILNDTLITNPISIAQHKTSLATGVALQGLLSLIPKNTPPTQIISQSKTSTNFNSKIQTSIKAMKPPIQNSMEKAYNKLLKR